MNLLKKKSDKKENELLDLSKVISRETLTLPIITTNAKKSELVADSELDADKLEDCDFDEKIEFTPKYISQGNASSIDELKEIIAKSKPPKLSFIINGDLSSLSENQKEYITKINAFDIDKVITAIKKNSEDIIKTKMQDDNETEMSSVHTRKYKIGSVFVKLQKEGSESPDCVKKSDETQKYMTADEIIAKRRKEQEEKRLKTAAFLESRDENKSITAMAKLYYQSDIEQHNE